MLSLGAVVASAQECVIAPGDPLRLYVSDGGRVYQQRKLRADFACAAGTRLDCTASELDSPSSCVPCEAGTYSGGGVETYTFTNGAPPGWVLSQWMAAGGAVTLPVSRLSTTASLAFSVPPPAWHDAVVRVSLTYSAVVQSCPGAGLYLATGSGLGTRLPPTQAGAVATYTVALRQGSGSAVRVVAVRRRDTDCFGAVAAEEVVVTLFNVTVVGLRSLDTACKPCPPGTAGGGGGPESCTMCSPNTFAPAGAARCAPCANATWEWSAAGAAACERKRWCESATDWRRIEGVCRQDSGGARVREVVYLPVPSRPCVVPPTLPIRNGTEPCGLCPAGTAPPAGPAGGVEVCEPCAAGLAVHLPETPTPTPPVEERRDSDVRCGGDITGVANVTAAECNAMCWASPKCVAFVLQAQARVDLGQAVPYCYLKACTTVVAIPPADVAANRTASAFVIDAAKRDQLYATMAATREMCLPCAAGTYAPRRTIHDGFDHLFHRDAKGAIDFTDGWGTQCSGLGCPAPGVDVWRTYPHAIYFPTLRMVLGLAPPAVPATGSPPAVDARLWWDVDVADEGYVYFMYLFTQTTSYGVTVTFSASPRGAGVGAHNLRAVEMTLPQPDFSYWDYRMVPLAPGPWRLEWRFRRIANLVGAAARQEFVLSYVEVEGDAAGGAEACVPCPAGHSCGAKVETPSACPAGAWAPVGAAECRTCAPGTATLVPATPKCAACGNMTAARMGGGGDVAAGGARCPIRCEALVVGNTTYNLSSLAGARVVDDDDFRFRVSLCGPLSERDANGDVGSPGRRAGGFPPCRDPKLGVFTASFACQAVNDTDESYSLGSFAGAHEAPDGRLVLAYHSPVEGVGRTRSDGGAFCRRAAYVWLQCDATGPTSPLTWEGEIIDDVNFGAPNCTYHFSLSSPAACPVCDLASDFVLVEGPCSGGVQRFTWIPSPSRTRVCVGPAPESMIKTCSSVSVWVFVALLCAAAVVAVVLIAVCVKYRRLQLRYSRLAQVDPTERRSP